MAKVNSPEINWSKVAKYIHARETVYHATLHDTYYIIRVRDSIVGEHRWIDYTGKATPDDYHVWSLKRFATPEAAEAYCETLDPELCGRVERGDREILVAEIVERYDIDFIPAEKTDDGLPHVRCSCPDEWVTQNLTYIKPALVEFFDAYRVFAEFDDSATPDERDAVLENIAAVNDAEKALDKIKSDLRAKAAPRGILDLRHTDNEQE